MLGKNPPWHDEPGEWPGDYDIGSHLSGCQWEPEDGPEANATARRQLDPPLADACRESLYGGPAVWHRTVRRRVPARAWLGQRHDRHGAEYRQYCRHADRHTG